MTCPSRFLSALLVVIALVAILVLPTRAQSPGTAFVYQGQLATDGALTTATCNFRFTLYDAESAGNAVGSAITRNGVAVSNGLFATSLDFGASAFTGAPRWLAIEVQCPGDAALIPLSPRQQLTPTPYAIFASGAPWSGISGKPSWAVNGHTAGAGLTLTGATFSVDTTTIQRRVSGSCDLGLAMRAVNADGTVECATTTESDPTAWHVTGDDAPSGSFIGTTNGTSLEMRTNNIITARYIVGVDSIIDSDTTATPAIIEGSVTNGIDFLGEGQTISGGNANGAEGSYSVIGGGLSNVAVGEVSTVAGGQQNQAQADHATVGGGAQNTAVDFLSWVGGGYSNTASNYASAIGGGYDNTASGYSAVVGGGYQNTASGLYSAVGGGKNNVAEGSESVVAGGANNTSATQFATIGGGTGNQVTGANGFVGGGQGNTSSNPYSAVAGGDANVAEGYASFVGAGSNNLALGDFSSIPGGVGARALLWGQTAHASYTFGDFGDAQASEYTLAAEVPNASSSELFLDGTGGAQRLRIPEGAAWAAQIQLVARAQGGDYAVAFYYCTIRNEATSVTGTCAPDPDFSFAIGGLDWAVFADNSSDALRIILTTPNLGESFRAVATVRTTEVSFP